MITCNLTDSNLYQHIRTICGSPRLPYFYVNFQLFVGHVKTDINLPIIRQGLVTDSSGQDIPAELVTMFHGQNTVDHVWNMVDNGLTLFSDHVILTLF